MDLANAFRAFVNEDETVQEQIKAAATAGTLYLAVVCGVVVSLGGCM